MGRAKKGEVVREAEGVKRAGEGRGKAATTAKNGRASGKADVNGKDGDWKKKTKRVKPRKKGFSPVRFVDVDLRLRVCGVPFVGANTLLGCVLKLRAKMAQAAKVAKSAKSTKSKRNSEKSRQK
ncbi:hypothetical protein W97_03013 [Coniosporium apollinis CBS 100218]|uniref:Uncharacterized protein n=1 Tax=Coniosporium apollinis (strain CBS 100218) TaxID=1168221 RepID=R7YPC7_CONA1|nr:uncharacterized protein W97_03013 [Coniosporium apollinis CBS 100218]EON63785.1 hypothetical protein W97_03013 [Coniosporium apollinis CBS 100218]